jgi:uncharacterized membrane protein
MLAETTAIIVMMVIAGSKHVSIHFRLACPVSDRNRYKIENRIYDEAMYLCVFIVISLDLSQKHSLIRNVLSKNS